MTENVILVSKERAKQLIDESPCDMVLITTVNTITFQHSNNKRVKKRSGVALINKAKEIKYQDNDFFGTLSLYGISEPKVEKNTIHNILFPQELEKIRKIE